IHTPTWSPDGTKLAYVRDEQTQDGASHIEIVDADGSHPRQLTPFGSHDAAPAWSPDGIKIAYECKPDICVVDASSGTVVGRPTSSDGIADRGPAWSPNGSEMAWQHGDSIWKMTADAMGSTQLTSGVPGASDTSPQWSPSGDKIVFVSHGEIRI